MRELQEVARAAREGAASGSKMALRSSVGRLRRDMMKQLAQGAVGEGTGRY